MAEHNNQRREEVFSKSVRAGKRTYFFDVKPTKSNDFYLTITESKKRMGDDGNPFYEKHKIFLDRQDFDKFSEAFNECSVKVNELKADAPEVNQSTESTGEQNTSFTDISFDDLGN